MTHEQNESIRRAIDPTPGELAQHRAHAAAYIAIQTRLLGPPDDERALAREMLRRAGMTE